MKKRSLRNLISVVLVVTMLLIVSVLFYGCNQGNKQPSAATKSEAPATTKSTEAPSTAAGSEETTKQEPVETKNIFENIPAHLVGSTVSVLFWYDPMASAEGPVIEAFTEKTGIKVNVLQAPYSEYTTKLAAMVATGDAPDVARLKNYSPNRLKTIQPISVSKFDFSDPAWDKVTMKEFTFNGQCYGVNLVNTPFFLPSVCFYNKATFEEYGLDDPYELWKKGEWNWETFRRICKEYASLDKEYRGATMAPLGSPASTLGGDFVKFDGEKYVNTMDEPEFLEGWKYTLDMIKEGSYSMDTWQMEEFMAGKIGIFGGDASGMQKKSDYFKKFKLKKELGVVPVPGFEGREYYLPMMETLAFGIPSGAKNPEAAPYFLRYYLDFDNYDKDDFFFDETALEVYNYLIKIAKRDPSLTGDIITVDSGYSVAEIEYILVRSDPLQLNTTLEGFRNVIDDAVAKANEALKGLIK